MWLKFSKIFILTLFRKVSRILSRSCHKVLYGFELTTTSMDDVWTLRVFRSLSETENISIFSLILIVIPFHFIVGVDAMSTSFTQWDPHTFWNLISIDSTLVNVFADSLLFVQFHYHLWHNIELERNAKYLQYEKTSYILSSQSSMLSCCIILDSTLMHPMLRKRILLNTFHEISFKFLSKMESPLCFHFPTALMLWIRHDMMT